MNEQNISMMNGGIVNGDRNGRADVTNGTYSHSQSANASMVNGWMENNHIANNGDGLNGRWS